MGFVRSHYICVCSVLVIANRIFMGDTLKSVDQIKIFRVFGHTFRCLTRLLLAISPTGLTSDLVRPPSVRRTFKAPATAALTSSTPSPLSTLGRSSWHLHTEQQTSERDMSPKVRRQIAIEYQGFLFDDFSPIPSSELPK